MADKNDPVEALRRRKAELLDAAAEVDRSIAEIEQITKLAAKYNLVVSPAIGSISHGDNATASGTLDWLIEEYLGSTAFTDLRFKTRDHYTTVLRKLTPKKFVKLSDLGAKDFQNWYDEWTNNGTEKLAMGRAAITMMRVLVNFGVEYLSNADCERIAVILHNMRFAVAKREDSRPLSKGEAVKIIEMAHKLSLPSIGLAQSLQFETPLRAKDILGEWVPLSETKTPLTTIIDGDEKWIRGLLWDEIDENLVLRHPSSVDGRIIEVSLKDCELVMRELSRMNLDNLPKTGPVIVFSKGRPWKAQDFRRYWRKIARECKVSDKVKFADGRTRRDEENENRPDDADLRSSGRR